MNFNLEFADPVVWNDEVDYAVNDVVFHDGEAYTAIDYVPIGTPLTDSTKWRRSGKYVRTADIADDSITTAKLDDSAVTNQKIADGAVSVEKLSSDIANNIINVSIHKTKGATDTSYVFVKMKRNGVSSTRHINSSTPSARPIVPEYTPFDFAEMHQTDYFLCTNISIGNLNYATDDPSFRYDGVDYTGTSYLNPYIAFDANGENIAMFAKGTLLDDVPSTYTDVMPITEILINNGETPSVDGSYNAPRNCFGWDDEYIYLMMCEGRGLFEYGMTFQDCQNFGLDNGIENWVAFDGGGSCCMAYNIGETTLQINKYRDEGMPFNNRRPTRFTQAYSFIDENYHPPINGLIAYATSENKGYPIYINWRGNFSQQTLFENTTPSSSTMFELAVDGYNNRENQFNLSSNYSYDSSKVVIPIPTNVEYTSALCTIEGFIEFQVPSGGSGTTDSILGVRVYQMQEDNSTPITINEYTPIVKAGTANRLFVPILSVMRLNRTSSNYNKALYIYVVVRLSSGDMTTLRVPAFQFKVTLYNNQDGYCTA